MIQQSQVDKIRNDVMSLLNQRGRFPEKTLKTTPEDFKAIVFEAIVEATCLMREEMTKAHKKDLDSRMRETRIDLLSQAGQSYEAISRVVISILES